jgi:hypothetical protein
VPARSSHGPPATAFGLRVGDPIDQERLATRNPGDNPQLPAGTRRVNERAAAARRHTLCSSRARDDVRDFRNPANGQPPRYASSLCRCASITACVRGEVPRSPVPGAAAPAYVEARVNATSRAS